MKKSYDLYADDIIAEDRDPTMAEFKVMGKMIMSEWWFNLKEKIKKIFKRT